MKKLMMMATTLAAMMSAGAVEFRVSPDGDDKKGDGSAAKPVRTLEKAMKLVRAIERDEDKTIVFADGFYPFERPVRLEKNDADLTIRAEHPGKVIFSGGVTVTGWRQDEEDQRFLAANLPFEPKEGITLVFLSSGEWCDIASYPDFPRGRVMKYQAPDGSKSINYDSDKLDFSDIDIASAWLVLPQEWSTLVTGIKEHDAENKIFTFKGGSVNKFNQGYRLMNTRHGMRKPGMWMFENRSKKIIYWPREGETAEKLDITISKSHSILAAAHVQGVKVEGIVFECCSKDPAYNNPYADNPNGAVTIGDAGLHVDNCEVRNCAGPGIFALKPDHARVTRTHVHHVGGECINYFDGGNASDIEWCHVHHGGLIEPSMLIGMQLSNCRCVGNKIHNGPACGVVMWSCNSVFASNDVSVVMYASKDGGGLYGGFTDCVLHDNYVHDIGGWPGLYADEGSQRVKYYNNRFENCFWPTHMHQTQFVTISNNTFKCDSLMRFSFQGSGHGVFCDNKIYTTEKITDDNYRDNCDFWGRNEVFVKQEDGSYKSEGLVTLDRRRRAPGTIEAQCLSDRKTLPLSLKGEMVFDAFNRGNIWTDVGGDGYPNIGVPCAFVNVAYDDYYLFVSFKRKWNQLCGYAGWKNQSSRGWKHADCERVDFDGGLYVLVHPTGSFECSRQLKMAPDDVKTAGPDNVIMRIPLEGLGVKGAKKQLAKLDLEQEEDGLLLTDEAADNVRGPEKKLPKPTNVTGCQIKFNATIWIEDLRESKSLFAPDGDKYATGTLKFVPFKKKR